MAAVVMVAFHRWRVLPLMARRQHLFKMTPGEPIDGIRLSAAALSDEEILRQGMRDIRKRQAEVPALVPRKALKVSTSSTAQWVVDAQAAIQRGMASARANPKEPVTQGEATEAATKKAGEEAPTPREARALESGEAKVPLIAEATEGEVEAPRTSEVEVAEARASKAFEAEVADVGAPRTTEAEVAEARASRTTEAEVAEAGLGTAELTGQDVEMEEGQASVPPLVQDPPPSQESA
ncbi:uncharacterized protein [Miscanthus floridulus]|uniref:uncharacterized protein n=1 Tax=Miscanthus floridulus TaxID=154761 RepID=UPI0034594731